MEGAEDRFQIFDRRDSVRVVESFDFEIALNRRDARSGAAMAFRSV